MITNTGYQKLIETKKKTATRDLRDLVDKEIREQVGTTGRGMYYVLRKNASKAKHEIEKSEGDLNEGVKGTQRGQRGHDINSLGQLEKTNTNQ